MGIKQSIGEVVREKRAQKTLTQEQLSYKVGVSNRFLQDIESGEKMASILTIFKLSKALSITPDKIILTAWQLWLNEEKRNG